MTIYDAIRAHPQFGAYLELRAATVEDAEWPQKRAVIDDIAADIERVWDYDLREIKRAIWAAAQNGKKQGNKRGRPRKPKHCPHCRGAL